MIKKALGLFYLFLPILLASFTAYLSAGENQPVTASWREQNLSVAEIAWLKTKPQLRLGIDSKFSPYEWINNKGEYIGIAADYIRLLEERLQIPIVPVTDKKSWSEVLKAAKKGEFDLMSCLVKTQERESYLHFSQPYLSSSAVIISEQASGYIGELDKLQGKTVAIHKGHYTIELLRRDYPSINLVTPASIQNALALVAQGKVDAFVGDATAASFVMKQESILNLSFSGHTDYQSEFSLGVYRDNPLLLSIINKALASISEQERSRIFDHWRGLKVVQGIALEKILIGLAIITLLILCFIYWNYRLRQSEAAHRLSEKRFKNLVAATDGIVWEAKAMSTEITYISDNAIRMLGYSQKDWRKPNFWAAHIHPDDRQDAVKFRKKAIDDASAREFEYRFITDSGKQVWIRDMISSITKEQHSSLQCGLMLDITAQKHLEQLKVQSEYRFRELIESLPAIAVQGCDEQMRITYWNDASSVLYGYTSEEVTGLHLYDVIVPQNARKAFIETHQQWLHQGSEIASKELDLQHKDGNTVPVFSSYVMLNANNDTKEMFCINVSLAEQKKANAELSYMAHFDPLTLLPNRRTFNDRLEQAMKRVQRSNNQIAIMMIDLDHFKEINDTLGHAYGDLLLQESAQRLLTCVRDTDTVARFGGDEFLLIIEKTNEISTYERIAKNILQQLSEPFVFNTNRSYISASIGITLYPSDASNSEELLKNADQAMYVAKKEGRNRFYYFTPQMQQYSQGRRRMLNELHDAIKKNQLEVYYQPIVSLATKKIIKAEALLRWNHPDGQILPDDFIPLAEESGLIIEIGDWVFKEAAQQSINWQLQICVNTSSLQFQSDHFCNQEYLERVIDSQHRPNFCIEITESLLMDKEHGVLEKLLALRDRGIEVALDDFGTGYSSLAYLKQFDIDYLKIDKSFIVNLQPNSQDKVLCEAMVAMAHTLDIKVIAEGVETTLQQDLLKSMQCDLVQGYLYSRPLPAQEFAAKWLS
jgi:diguanylate cyclase (GGDEF)-like protein/PAS domain S-box-containing protein